MVNLEDCEKVAISQGAIHIGPYDTKGAVGYLELSPHQSLVIHKRPAKEKLTQIKNSCSMVVYDQEGGRTVTLGEGDQLEIEPNIWHIHVNPYDETSLTNWKFEGDIVEIIEEIKKKGNT